MRAFVPCPAGPDRLPPVASVAWFEVAARRMALPDTSLDLAVIGDRIDVIGPMRRARATRYPAGSRVLLVSIDPVAAAGWLGVPLAELTDRVVDLADIDGALAGGLLGRLAAGQTLTPQLRAAAGPSRAATAARMLSAGHGVAATAACVNIGERQLARSFEQVTGLPPKLFARIARLRRAVRCAKRGAGLAEAAAAAGFADQAHFARETRALTGGTPTAILPDVGNVRDAGSAPVVWATDDEREWASRRGWQKTRVSPRGG